MALTTLLILAAIAALPCAASAMTATDPAPLVLAEIDDGPEALSVETTSELDLDHFPGLGIIVAGVISGLIVAAITNPSTTARIIEDVVSHVADAYESQGQRCVESSYTC